MTRWKYKWYIHLALVFLPLKEEITLKFWQIKTLSFKNDGGRRSKKTNYWPNSIRVFVAQGPERVTVNAAVIGLILNWGYEL